MLTIYSSDEILQTDHSLKPIAQIPSAPLASVSGELNESNTGVSKVIVLSVNTIQRNSIDRNLQMSHQINHDKHNTSGTDGNKSLSLANENEADLTVSYTCEIIN